jgi:putative ABC transport system permease protein
VAGWKPALRLARRDALRNKGRSVLVLVMIALPVLAVSAAEVVYQTSDVAGTESLDRRLGSADARVVVSPGSGRVIQGFDPDRDPSGSLEEGDQPPVTLEGVRAVLGRDVPATERRDGGVRVDTERGVLNVEATELETDSPLVEGLFRLTDGRWPGASTEVVVNEALAEKGFAAGSELTVHDGRTLTVVGTAESTTSRGYPLAVGTLGTLGIPTTEGQATWLVGGGPVSWDDVDALNRIGATVLSRAVVEDPPPDSVLPPQLTQWQASADDAFIAIIVLIVVMALLEVVLLAGPAFAVGARRQSRTLALMAASGGTPKQSRRVILAGGLVLGVVASILGVVLGVGVGWALLPVVQHYSDTWLGPFDLTWWHVLLVAGFGMLSAFLAAVVPAFIASRQDVVAVLAGRRGDRQPSLRSPLLGLVLLGAGIAGAVAGARARIDLNGGDGSLLIAGSAVVSVLGMILVVPVVVSVLARLARRLPLVARYAVRDAARHRTRTVPAVAAVAATVAGVVALGIANASDAAESEATYTPQVAMGMGTLAVSDPDVDWARYQDAVHREAPTVGVTAVTSYDPFQGDTYTDIRVRRPEVKGYDMLLDSWGGSFGNLLVGPEMLVLATPAHEEDLEPARQMLEQGGVVVFTTRPVEGDRIRISGSVNPATGAGKPERLVPQELPAYFLQVRGSGPALAVAAAGSLDPMGLSVQTAGLLLDAGDLSSREEGDLREVVQGMSDNAYLYVERGYQNDNATNIVLAILFTLGGVLMLGGTLTATFLALSDARPDLATLSAVGATPRTRRGVAAAYALVVGFVGALLGAAVGFIPGIAITYPLTSTSWAAGGLDARGNALPSHFIDVPWTLVIGLVVVLPLLTALIVGLTARSRLPLVARLD